jgi:hypothetical protein
MCLRLRIMQISCDQKIFNPRTTEMSSIQRSRWITFLLLSVFLTASKNFLQTFDHARNTLQRWLQHWTEHLRQIRSTLGAANVPARMFDPKSVVQTFVRFV